MPRYQHRYYPNRERLRKDAADAWTYAAPNGKVFSIMRIRMGRFVYGLETMNEIARTLGDACEAIDTTETK